MPKGVFKRTNSILFYDWCIQNSREDLIDRWDYELNKQDLKLITFKDNTKRWFKCPNGIHKSELKRISDITSGHDGSADCIGCHSFAQYLINKYGKNALNLYWDYEKNTIDPYSIRESCHHTVWIKCQDKDYHDSYPLKCNMFVRGDRCPYCHSLRVHKLDSLGYLYPQVLEIWSDKNKKSPYEVTPKSHYKAIWICENDIHDEYKRSVKESNDANFHCPNCVRERTESFLQEKVRLYLSEKLGYTLNHEWNCTLVPHNPKNNMSMPFDNEVIDLKLIIEVHGAQHYEENSYTSIWNKKDLTPKEQLHKRQLYDRYKKYVASRNGYFYLAIPYWTEKDESYKQLIDNKIKEIFALSINLESA